MVKQTEITLIGESPEAHGVFDAPEETKRTVPCTEKSLGLKLTAEARAAGLSPDLVIELEHDFLYHGEKLAEYCGERCEIQRAYPYEKRNGIELILKRDDGNARALTEEAADG